MKPAFLAIFCAVSLLAADFWQGKAYTEWSDKDLHRMISNSPWAHAISISGGGDMMRSGGSNRRSMGEAGSTMNDDGGFGGPGGGGGRRRGNPSDDTPSAPPPLEMVIRWQSALPVRQALVRMKYGSEAATSPEAKKILGEDGEVYVIAVTGVTRGMLRGQGDALKQSLMEHASLTAKGKDAVKPADVRIGQSGRAIEAYFLFPRTAAFTLDDKEIEFGAKFEGVNLKQKFHLKEMIFDGKLAL